MKPRKLSIARHPKSIKQAPTQHLMAIEADRCSHPGSQTRKAPEGACQSLLGTQWRSITRGRSHKTQQHRQFLASHSPTHATKRAWARGPARPGLCLAWPVLTLWRTHPSHRNTRLDSPLQWELGAERPLQGSWTRSSQRDFRGRHPAALEQRSSLELEV